MYWDSIWDHNNKVEVNLLDQVQNWVARWAQGKSKLEIVAYLAFSMSSVGFLSVTSDDTTDSLFSTSSVTVYW